MPRGKAAPKEPTRSVPLTVPMFDRLKAEADRRLIGHAMLAETILAIGLGALEGEPTTDELLRRTFGLANARTPDTPSAP